MGDFNVDYKMRNQIDYRHHDLSRLLEEATERMNMIQLITFDTWERIVLNNIRKSCLDHIYVKESEMVQSINSFKPNC